MSAYTMQMPDLGEGVVEAEIVAWLVGEGAQVDSETPLAEVMTEKVTVELMAPVAGRVARLLVAAGEVVTVGTPIVELVVAESVVTESVTESVVDGVVRVDSEAGASASLEGESAVAAPARALAAGVDAGEASRSAVSASAAAEPFASSSERRPRAAPTVRRRARELGVDLARVAGSGPGGRVRMEDLEGGVRAAPLPRASRESASSVQPLRGLRRVIAGRMEQAWSEIAHITYVEEVDMQAVEGLREQLNQERGKESARVTLLPFIARAMVLACREQPQFNATFRSDSRELELHGAVHLGVATQTERGLVVPVVHDADQLGLFALADAIGEVTRAAREGRLEPDGLRGSTITLSSLGRLGGVATTPIINPPEVAVVGVNKMAIRPVWNEGAFVARPMMNLSSSFDHRIIDGHDAATFVQHVKRLLEQPALLALEWSR